MPAAPTPTSTTLSHCYLVWLRYPSVCLPPSLSVSLSVSVCLSVCLPVSFPPFCLISLSHSLSVSPSPCLSPCLSHHLLICLPIWLPPFMSPSLTRSLSVPLPACLTIQPVSPDPAGLGLFLRLPAEGAPPDQRAVPEEEGRLWGHAGAQIRHTHAQLNTYTHTWTLTFMWQRLLSWNQPGQCIVTRTLPVFRHFRSPRFLSLHLILKSPPESPPPRQPSLPIASYFKKYPTHLRGFLVWLTSKRNNVSYEQFIPIKRLANSACHCWELDGLDIEKYIGVTLCMLPLNVLQLHELNSDQSFALIYCQSQALNVCSSISQIQFNPNRMLWGVPAIKLTLNIRALKSFYYHPPTHSAWLLFNG